MFYIHAIATTITPSFTIASSPHQQEPESAEDDEDRESCLEYEEEESAEGACLHLADTTAIPRVSPPPPRSSPKLDSHSISSVSFVFQDTFVCHQYSSDSHAYISSPSRLQGLTLYVKPGFFAFQPTLQHPLGEACSSQLPLAPPVAPRGLDTAPQAQPLASSPAQPQLQYQVRAERYLKISNLHSLRMSRRSLLKRPLA